MTIATAFADWQAARHAAVDAEAALVSALIAHLTPDTTPTPLAPADAPERTATTIAAAFGGSPILRSLLDKLVDDPAPVPLHQLAEAHETTLRGVRQSIGRATNAEWGSYVDAPLLWLDANSDDEAVYLDSEVRAALTGLTHLWRARS